MLKALMRTLFAVLVMVLFIGMPMLAIASPATASPPVMVCDLAPEMVQEPANHYVRKRPLPGDDVAIHDQRLSSAAPSYPLRE